METKTKIQEIKAKGKTTGRFEIYIDFHRYYRKHGRIYLDYQKGKPLIFTHGALLTSSETKRQDNNFFSKSGLGSKASTRAIPFPFFKVSLVQILRAQCSTPHVCSCYDLHRRNPRRYQVRISLVLFF